MTSRIQIRRGTATEWTSANPVLALGEMGYETNTQKLKIGNNTTAWNDLPYLNLGGSGGGSQGIQGIQGTAANVQGIQGIQGIQGPPGSGGGASTQGLQGNQGFQGILGNEGAQGIQGFDGQQGPPGTGFIFRGPWNSNLTYTVNDVVTYDGNSWVCENDNSNDAPGNNPTSWDILAYQGDPGNQGIQGIQGNGGIQGVQGIQGISQQGIQGIQGTRGLDTITQDILPDGNETRNIGSPTLKFKSIYLGAESMYLGTSKVSVGPTNLLELSKTTTVTASVVDSVEWRTNNTVVFTDVVNTSELFTMLDSLAVYSNLIGTKSDDTQTSRLIVNARVTSAAGSVAGKTNFTVPVDVAASALTSFTKIEIIKVVGSFVIPGPYADAAAAGADGVPIGGQWYDGVGGVYVRLT